MNTHNTRREDARKTLCALSFCAYTAREKENTKTHKDTRTNKTNKQDKPRTTKTKPQKIGEEDEKQRTKG